MSSSRVPLRSVLVPVLLMSLSALAAEPVPVEPRQRHLEFRERLVQRNAARLAAFLEEHGDSLLTTADAVLARHVAATGGREAWESIRTMRIRFRSLDTGGGDMVLVRSYRRPLHFRQGMEGGGSATVTDGTTVWRAGPDGWSEQENPAITHMASLDHFMLDPESGGAHHEFVGVEIVNHAPVYHLRRSFDDGQVEEMYFNIETGLFVERYTDYMSGPSWFSYWDYRDVGGVLVPHVRVRSVNELGPPHGIGVIGVELNPPLDDALFDPPESPGR